MRFQACLPEWALINVSNTKVFAPGRAKAAVSVTMELDGSLNKQLWPESSQPFQT